MTEFKVFQEERPWGNFRQFTHNESTTVKIITVNAGSSLSLQTHNHRKEFWRIVSGHPIVTIDEEVKIANPGDEFMIETLQAHRLEAKDDNVQVLEIAFGDFDENDIKRLEDKYGRS